MCQTFLYEQDVKNKTILNDVDSASDDYLRKVRELNPGKRKEEMEKIQKMFKKAKEHGEDKVNKLFLHFIKLFLQCVTDLD